MQGVMATGQNGKPATELCSSALRYAHLKIVLCLAYMSMMEFFIVALIMAEDSDAVLLVQGIEMETDSAMALAEIGRLIRYTDIQR